MSKLPIPFRMHSSGWFLIAACAVFGTLYCGWESGPTAGCCLVVSLLVHEAGHMLVAASLGVRVHEFGLCWAGAYNRRANAGRRRDEILISIAGPLMNFSLVFPFLLVPVIGAQVAVWNLALCVLNLLPLPSTDGLRIVRTLSRPRNVGAIIGGFRSPNSPILLRLR